MSSVGAGAARWTWDEARQQYYYVDSRTREYVYADGTRIRAPGSSAPAAIPTDVHRRYSTDEHRGDGVQRTGSATTYQQYNAQSYGNPKTPQTNYTSYSPAHQEIYRPPQMNTESNIHTSIASPSGYVGIPPTSYPPHSYQSYQSPTSDNASKSTSLLETYPQSSHVDSYSSSSSFHRSNEKARYDRRESYLRSVGEQFEGHDGPYPGDPSGEDPDLLGDELNIGGGKTKGGWRTGDPESGKEGVPDWMRPAQG